MNATGLKAACLAVGLATVWGNPADAQFDQIRLSITPSNDLSHVYFMYRSNSSGLPFTIQSLPDLMGGTSTTLTFSVSGIVTWGADAFYSVIGLYDEANKRVTIGCNSGWAQNVIGNGDFNTEFSDPQSYPFTENDFAAALLGGEASSQAITWFLWQKAPLTPIDDSSQLVNFSNASDGGSLLAEIIPEPSPILLMGFGALIMFAFFRKQEHSPSFKLKRTRDP